jgi:ParB-like chromosome segregation protein Spo0J
VSKKEIAHIPVDTLLEWLGCSRARALALKDRQVSIISDGTEEEIGYSDKEWNDLLESIRREGIKQPLFLTREANNVIFLEDGCHRLAAAVALNLASVPVEIE